MNIYFFLRLPSNFLGHFEMNFEVTIELVTDEYVETHGVVGIGEDGGC